MFLKSNEIFRSRSLNDVPGGCRGQSREIHLKQIHFLHCVLSRVRKKTYLEALELIFQNRFSCENSEVYHFRPSSLVCLTGVQITNENGSQILTSTN